ncbi:MAG: Flp pilus assembly protein CpaB [Proteobacteria bacterium]|nr:MAG: Flp pilus assembly protein CpaB [Pseudomonadota bacterium]
MGSNETRNLWLSIGAAIFASFLLYSWSQDKRTEYSTKYGKTKTIVVAKEDISEMRTIYDTMLTTIDRPSEFVDPDVVTNPDEIIGNVAAVPIKKGQSIVKSSLLTPGPDTGISLQIAPSKRAIPIPVDDVRGVAKLIRPGDRVDILAAVDTGKGVNQRREVQTLMQDVVVLATGVNIMNNIPRVFELDSSGKSLSQIALTGDTKYSTITIEATQKEAQDLVYILSTAPGNLYFTLRNPNDRTIPPRLPASTSDSITGKPIVSMDAPSMPMMTAPVITPTAPAPRMAIPLPKKKTGFKTL